MAVLSRWIFASTVRIIMTIS